MLSGQYDKFEFGTKAETLARLGPIFNKCSIPSVFHFTVAEWRMEPDVILSKIADKYGDKQVIVRSSAISEDSGLSAMAGVYLSVPDIPANNQKRLKEAIDDVINSYYRKSERENLGNQVLIQYMINNVTMSGVLFTQDLNTGAPYYVINYDDESGRTDTVASGNCNRTLLVHRESWQDLKSPRFVALFEAVREIENTVEDGSLDIEFALDEDLNVYLFQVRQITTKPNWNRGITLQVNDAVERIKSAVRERLRPQPGIRGSRSILGKMPDWNPAEMIGSTPRPLAISLYRYLITDSVWRLARKEMGYAHPSGMPLMMSLCGQPYIDVRLSFHSYLPNDLPEDIGDKLVNSWLDRLDENPHLHDKVEFDVAITTLDFDFDKSIKRLIPGVLNSQELEIYKSALQRITNDILKGDIAPIDTQLAKLEFLTRERKALLESSTEPNLYIVNALFEECIKYGTIPFSILARYGFIAKSFLKSLLSRGILSDIDIELFNRSFPTIASEFINDLDLYVNKKLTKGELMDRYGHLRPGTYNILSIRYDQRKDLVANISHYHSPKEVHSSFTLNTDQRNAIESLLNDLHYEVSVDQLFDFLKKAIQSREYAKFIFTRNISDALEIISLWGEKIGLSRDELSYLDIREILDAQVIVQGRNIEHHLREFSEQGRQRYQVTKAIRLPHLIRSISDIVVVPLLIDQPNFITNKTIHAGFSVITGADTDLDQIDNKIVVIESADPGFDWIFTRPIKGLITKYGGANSHMAIRCAEFNLPAAIGCGEQIFDRVLKSKIVEINCAEGRINPIHG